MRRTILRIGAAAAVLAALGGLLAWRRTDVHAALLRLSRALPAAKGAGPEGPDDRAVAAPAERIDDGWCAARAGDDPRCPRELPVIRLARPETARRIGLETAPVEERPHAETIVGNAEVTYDAHTFAEVLPRVAGIVREVHAAHGQAVKPGDVLAVIDSAEVGSAKARYLGVLPMVKLAEANSRRIEELVRSNAKPLKDELEATAALNRARADLLDTAQRLKNLGFTDDDLEQIERNRDVDSRLDITCPIEGTVIERHAVIGEAISAQHTLVQVADLRELWAWVDIREGDITRIEPGMPVELTISGLEGRTFRGDVHWIDAAVNRATRTIRVIAEIANDDGLLRANQFGRGTIVLGDPHTAVLVPREAVQTLGATPLVFLAAADGSYRPQRIALRGEPEVVRGMAEVEWGLEPGTSVVTTGSYLLASELVEDEAVAAALARSPRGGP